MSKGTGKARRFVKALPLVVLDTIAVFVAYVVGAWGLKIEGIVFSTNAFGAYLFFMAAINIAVFAAFKMYSVLWRYASVSELVRVFWVVTLGCIVSNLAAALVFGERLPIRSYLFAWALMLIVCGASRFAIRLYSGAKTWSVMGVTEDEGLPRSIVVGAGEVGSLTVKRMQAGNQDMSGCPVALVDDDRTKQGQFIHGVKVMGTIDDIPQLCRDLKAQQIVVAIPSSTRAQRDRIFKICMKTGVKTLTLPLLADMPCEPGDKVALREVEISDLLSRDEVELELNKMGYVSGKRVLVTGGGGSIGSEIVRQLLPAKPAQIVLLDIYENTTYELYHELRRRTVEQGIDLRVEICSITNVPALERVFDRYKPQVVFHAAAHKHVPLMEADPREAIENNVFGTLNVVRLTHQRGCTHFVQISTDKAVNPTNVMGATKRMCEMIVQYYAKHSKTVFTAVRFGNVLGSHGSVIPLFKRQLHEGGPITVTHRDITRYFMTIPEASRLVITAGALAHGGEIFVLDMGKPVKIYDLAVNLIKLSGLTPGRDIEIVETGLRPGEKMYEELLMDTEHLIPTDNKEIRVSTGEALGLEAVEAKLSELKDVLPRGNDDIKRVLADAVPTYTPQFEKEEGLLNA